MKFKTKPNIPTEDSKIDKEKKAQEILARADHPASLTNHILANKDSEIKPWRKLIDESIKDVNVFSFRIPREEMLQLKYISKESMISINALCLTAIRTYIKKSIKEMEENEQ
jgi:NRPS condensation-like uncharacterized protein